MPKKQGSNNLQNQAIKSGPSSEHDLISHLNRIINTQDCLNGSNLAVSDFLGLAAKQVHDLTKSTGTVIELIKEDYLVYTIALGSFKKFEGQRLDKNIGISGLSLSTHQIIRSDDTETDTRINTEECKIMGARSLVIAPFFQEHQAAGVIKIASNKANAFSEVDIQTIRVIAGMIGTALSWHHAEELSQKLERENAHLRDETRKLEKKMRHVVHHDYLTGLPNRNLFNDHLKLTMAKCKRKKMLVALMYLDIDNFNHINETHGDAIGDKLLQAFAHRLKQSIRSSDIAARLGGDEFTVLVDDIKNEEDAIIITNKILQSMRQPFHLDGKDIHITTSIGIAFLRDLDIAPDDFIRQADQALYVSKNSGRNTFYIYDNDLVIESKLV